MKKMLFYFFFLCLLPALSCKKQEAKPDVITEGYIIGFDQCTAGQRTNHGAGFVIVANNHRDTLLTYSLPDSLYDFPDHLFAKGLYSPLFPESARNKYKITFSYRLAAESEKKQPFVLCRGDIYNPVWYTGPEIIITKIINFTVAE
jgi:hypothetical protein